SQAVEKGYSVLNSARIGEKLEQLFRMTKTTPFQMNNVRLALERKALAIAPSDIDYFLDRNSDEDKQTDGRLSGGGQKKKNVSDALKKIKDSLSPILISVEESDEIIILLFPPNVEITSKREEQSWLVSAVLGSPYFKEQVLGKRENSERKFRASILLAHLILYLIFVFSIGLVYRKLEYRDRGNVPDLKSAPTPWHFRVGSFMSGINKLLAPLRSWWSKLAIYTVALIGVLLFVYSGAHASFVWLPLGVLALLLFPPSSVLKKSWAVSIKIAQAILLQVIGFFAFSAAIYLLTGGGQFAGDSLAPTFWKPSFFFISAIVLIFLGKVKFALTNDEKLAREPNRAPVVYVRSFDNARQDWRQAWAASSTRFLRPVEEQVLSSIFGALGPFITTGRSVEDLSRSAAEKEVIQARRKRDSQLIDRSELVILQIDEGPTGEYLANIRKILLSLKPGQVLVYFSHLMNPDLLRQTYERFIEETLDVFPNPLPFSIGSKRLLAFDDDWTPRLIGEVSRPKFLFGKFLPVVGRWLDTFFARRSVARTLKPFFENRNLVDPRLRLFSELSIGVASFPLFGLFPAGYMMFINLWRAGRRTVAVVGFFAPVIFFLIFIFAHGFFGQYLIFISQSWVVEETLFVGTLITIIFGFPFATHWTWKRFSGRLIGQHEAFGGTLQPFWKSLLPPVVGVLLLVALAGVRYQFVIAPQNARVEAWDIARKGREFAEKGKLEDAVTRFEEALERSPEIDLVFETQRIDRVPKAVAHVWYGVRLAELGDIDGAVTNFRKAQELDSEIVLDPDREFYRDSREPDRDPRIVAKRLRSYILIDKGRELALDGKKEAAIKDFKKALELDKNADLNPNTDEKEQVPEAVYFVLRGGKLAEEGDVEKATEAFNAALITLEGIKLPNGTDRPDDDKGRDPKKAAQALAASVKVNDGRDLAQKGALDKAIDAFSKALKLDPQFDLNPMTKSIESNPEAVALVWYGARSAEQGNLTEAIDSFRKARKLDPKIELDPNGNFDSDLNDPQKVANYLASRVNRKL
ncbi:MAG: hypothetical protein OEM82_09580, partial [Acidobacteriota bacterium]|nr:hypothetical protein [Acidobacteriota bacterium]